jgi:hypothetical protein
MYQSSSSKYNFIIEEDTPETGWFLYVYENEKCIADYMQDSLELTKEFAFEEYEVAMNSWKVSS